MGSLKGWIKSSAENIRNSGIEVRGYYFLLIFAFLACLFGGTFNIYLGFPPASYIILFLGCILMVVSFLLINMKKNEKLVIEIVMCYLCYIMIPSLWLTSGGLRGSTAYYGLVLVIAAPAFLKGPRRILHPVLFISLILSLIVYEYHNPGSISDYSSAESRIWDISLNLTFTIFFLTYMINILIVSYRAEHAKLIEISTHDDLTGVFNRRFMMDYIEKCLSNEKSRGNFCVILVDFDDFKSVNDTFGHLEGDRMIVSVSRIIEEKVNGTGKVGRIGGDEFIIFLENAGAGKEDVKGICADILETVCRKEKTSLSAGICFAKKGYRLSDLISNADRKLYSAKNKGKNRFEM